MPWYLGAQANPYGMGAILVATILAVLCARKQNKKGDKKDGTKKFKKH